MPKAKDNKKKAKKQRAMKYWLAATQGSLNDPDCVRSKKRGEAFEAWKGDKDKFAKPVRVEVGFENIFDLFKAATDGRRESAETKALNAAASGKKKG